MGEIRDHVAGVLDEQFGVDVDPRRSFAGQLIGYGAKLLISGVANRWQERHSGQPRGGNELPASTGGNQFADDFYGLGADYGPGTDYNQAGHGDQATEPAAKDVWPQIDPFA